MKWRKLGRIIEPSKEIKWMQTHAMLPTVDYLEGDIYRVYFSGRDGENRSLIGYADIDISKEGFVVNIAKEPILGFGELGCFDDNGVTPTSIVTHNGKKYLYYVGWKPRSTTRFGLIAGLAIGDSSGNFKRYSRAPILRTSNEEPIAILTAPFVMKNSDKWKMWYVSGIKWENPDSPKYNIKYAESDNGIDWKQNIAVCIDAVSEDETALARPCILKEDGIYKMWYSYKRDGKKYRMGYAESDDGKKWMRMDDRIGIEASSGDEWDSEMIEYGFIFNHKGNKYMIYNGNGYGINGAGLAIQEKQ
ncbi:MAG: hypothetical protein P9X22_07835 [Candidatus Zapsychrus exili]|nr:hypothetical protein [Candidatus Zapsychrus exili]